MKLSFVLLASLLVGLASASPVLFETSQPWNGSGIDQGFDTVFGSGNWTLETSASDPGAIFNDDNRFVFLEGGDGAWSDVRSLYLGNQALIDGWVGRGGSLVIDAAPNQSGDLVTGFGGAIVVDPLYSHASYNEYVVDPTHPIFSGPYGTQGDFYSNFAAHAEVGIGSSFSTLLVGDDGHVGMAERDFGAGHVILSGLTTPYMTKYGYLGGAMVPNWIGYASGRATPQAVPEPTAMAALGLGIGTVLLRRGRKPSSRLR